MSIHKFWWQLRPLHNWYLFRENTNLDCNYIHLKTWQNYVYVFIIIPTNHSITTTVHKCHNHHHGVCWQGVGVPNRAPGASQCVAY